MQAFRSGRHVLFHLHVHLVFTTKYRPTAPGDGVITERVRDALHSAMTGVCADFDAQLLGFDGEDDHVHLLVSYPPKVALSKLVGSLKGASAHRIRGLDLSEVKSKLWGSHFWSPSYCAVSCGPGQEANAPLEVVKRYIEDQRAPNRKKGEKRGKDALTSP